MPCPTLRHLSQGLSSSWAGTVSARGRGFPTHRRGFQGPFPPWRGVEWPLCSSAALITSLPAAFPSFSPFLPLIPPDALPWFCRRCFCCPRCPGRVSPHPLAGSTVQLTPPRGTAPSAPLPCASDPSVWVQHAEAFSSGLALVCVRVCSACISLASPGFSIPQEIFFFFSSLLLPKYLHLIFLFSREKRKIKSEENQFLLTSKHTFAVFTLSLDALLPFTHSAASERNKLGALFPLPFCKRGILSGSKTRLLLLVWCRAADLPRNSRSARFCADTATPSPVRWDKAAAPPASSAGTFSR